MKITQEADYAIRIMLFLSKMGMGTIIDANRISQSENIPIRFTLKILRKLTKAGLTKSYRGVTGGYSVNRAPEDISLKDVIETIDGPIYINRCLYDVNHCNLHRTPTCEVHKALNRVRLKIIHELDSLNFKNIIEDNYSDI